MARSALAAAASDTTSSARPRPSSRERVSVPRLACLLLAALVLLAPTTGAAEPDEKEKDKGPRYQNRELGLTATGPKGWKISVDDGRSLQWTRLATWFDEKNKSEAVLSVRPRKSKDLSALEQQVLADWKDAVKQNVLVQSPRRIEPNALQPTAQVIVDAVHRPPVGTPQPGGRAAAPRETHYRAVYYLAPAHELLLYIKAPESLWSRLRPAMDKLRTSLRFEGGSSDIAKGEGAYRDERNGMSCVYPKDYAVVMPKAARHIARFEGVGADQPLVDIYRIPWDQGASEDAARLLTYYRDELAGEATTGNAEVSGFPAVLVDATARIQGSDQAIRIAVVKRGDHIIRVRVAGPIAKAADVRAVFNKVAASMKLTQGE